MSAWLNRSSLPGSIAVLAVVGLLGAIPSARGAATDPAALFDLSLEELMAMEIASTSASKTPVTTRRAPGTVYAFSGDQLRSEGVRTLEDLLERIPGVQLSPNRQGHTSAWFRGVGDRYNSKILLLIDSVPIRDMYYSNFLIDEMHPIELIQTVEVLLGPSSVLYGADAFAGIISITTKKQTDEVTLSAMSHETYSGAAHVSHEKLSIFAKYLSADDGFTPEFGRDGETRRTDQDPDRDLAVVDIKYDLTDNITLGLSKTDYEYPFLYSRYDRTTSVNRSPLVAHMNLIHGDLETLQIDLTSYFVHYDFEFEEEKVTETGPVTPREYELDEMNTQYGGMDLYLSKALGDHTLLLGTSLFYHEAADDVLETKWDIDPNGALVFDAEATKLDDPDARYWDHSVYLQDQWALDPNLDLTLGLRYDSPDDFEGQWSTRAGLVYTLARGFYAKALFGTAYRTPSYREYRKTDEGVVLFDPNLEPEHVHTYELALGQRVDEQTSWLVTGFYNEYKDYIADVYVPSLGDEVFFNFDKQVTRGLELSGTHWFADKTWRLNSSITFIDTQDRDTRDELHGVSNVLAHAHLTYYAGKALKMGLTANYVGRPHVDDDYQSDVPAEHRDPGLNDDYVVLGAYATYRLNKNIEIQFAGHNITDEERYAPHYGPSSAYDYEWPGAFLSLSLVIRQ